MDARSSADKLDELSYLWDGSDREWMLFHVNPSAPVSEARFVIQNERTKVALIIEDDDQYEEVINRMKNAKVKVKTL